MRASLRMSLLWLLILGVAAVLAACGPSIAMKPEVTRSALTEEQLNKVISSLDCSKCMHKASSGAFTKPEDVAASCEWLPRASLIALVSGASEKRVAKDCFPPPESFLPKDFQCYAYSQIQFRKQLVLRDDAEFNNDDSFRTSYYFGRFAGLMNGIQVLPDHRYLIFSNRDESSLESSDKRQAKDVKLGILHSSSYPLRAACDLETQPPLPALDKSTRDKETGEGTR